MQTNAVVVEKYGERSVLSFQEIALPPPSSLEVQIRHEAIGLNFIDIYQRNGLYPLPLPVILGSEGAGIVTRCGEGVSNFKIGDRVAYGNCLGGYARERNIPADKIVLLPEYIPSEAAAALMLRGMTAEYLLHRTYAVQPGDTVLWHAAAGGLSQIAIPWLKQRKATVIGTVGSENKKATAFDFGCDHVILSGETFAKEVRNMAPEGLPVVYDSIGAATFEQSLLCLKPRGLMVSFGNASGPVDRFNLAALAKNGSLFLTRPSLAAYIQTRKELELSSSRLIAFLKDHKEVMTIKQRFSLHDIQTAHHALESRKTTGLSILLP